LILVFSALNKVLSNMNTQRIVPPVSDKNKVLLSN